MTFGFCPRGISSWIQKKTQAVRDWPQPSLVKEVQRFIGFANFYRKFIRNLSAAATPLADLTKKKSGPFVWLPEAERAFRDLKVRFSSAPILTLPDPSLPFIVEVDASDMAVGAVLSQNPADGRLHPCAFFSACADVKCFVAACPVCVQSKSPLTPPRTPPMVSFTPYPSPSNPGPSSILDFITGLPLAGKHCYSSYCRPLF